MNEPRTVSLVDTCSVSLAVVVEITACPAALNDKLVPELSVPAATAEAMAVCKLATVDKAPAVKEKVCPVEASEIEVIEPSVSDESVVKGDEAVPPVELADFEGGACVSTAVRFATLLLLPLDPNAFMASNEGSLIDTLIPDAA